jgi:transcriptional regulator with XRE-family HTH domain
VLADDSRRADDMAVAPLRGWTADEIGKRIRNVRLDMGMETQAQLAKSIDATSAWVGKLESGGVKGRPESWLERIAHLHAATMGSDAKTVFDYLMCDRSDFAYMKHLGPSSAPSGDGGAVIPMNNQTRPRRATKPYALPAKAEDSITRRGKRAA